MKKSVKLAVVTSVIALFPIAFLLALFWRFPLPFAGYESGLEAAVKSPLAVLFYGIMGGFLVVPGLSALAGIIVWRTVKENNTKAKRLIQLLAIVIAFIFCYILSVLDRYIGEW